MNLVWPRFDSAFLNQVVSSIKKRSKSIKSRVREISIQKVIEKDDGLEVEKLEVELIFGVSRVSARLFFWDDRYIWIDSRSPGKVGWDKEWCIEGRMGEFNVDEFRSALDLSITIWQAFSVDSYLELDRLWSRIALSRPSKI